MNKSILIIRDWPMDENKFNHGGHQRSFQLQKYIESTGACVETVTLSDLRDLQIGSKLSPKRLLFSLSCLPKSISQLKTAHTPLFSLHTWFKNKGKKYDVVFWENTHRYNYFKIIKKYSKTIIAVPQNIESMCFMPPSLFHAKTELDAFIQEVKNLALCDQVLTISEFDRQVLSNFQIGAELLKFVTPGALTNQKSYKNRMSCKQQNVALLLASVTNPPSFRSTQELLDRLQGKTLSVDSVIIVGNGSETLDTKSHPQIRIEGRVSNERLKELKATCRMALVFQLYGAGALTRVSELLLAGIPVVINESAIKGNLHFVEHMTILPDQSYQDFIVKKLSLLRGPSIESIHSIINQVNIDNMNIISKIVS